MISAIDKRFHPRSRAWMTAAGLLGGLICALIGASAAAQDQIGIYWDEAFTQDQATAPAVYSVVTGYIVIHDPTSPGGILAWECKVDIEGPALVSGWNVAGQAINAATPPQFAVGLAAPLPPAADTAVAAFDLVVTDLAPILVSLEPLFFASIPGEMAYLGGDAPEQLVAMTPVTGTALVATVNNDIPVPELSRRTIQFGVVALGLSRTETVTVTNVGGGVLDLDVALDCVGAGYSLTGVSGPVSLTAGQSTTVDVRFTPTGYSLVECTLLLGDGVPTVAMIGSGRDPITSWTVPDDVDFGTVIVGQDRLRFSTLINDGETTLNLDVGLVAACDGIRIIMGGGVSNLAPGGLHRVTLEFAPTVPGSWSCQLGFGDGLPVVAVEGVAVWGTTEYTITPSLVEFPITEPGTSIVRTVQLHNTGSAPIGVVPTLSPASPAFAVGRSGESISVLPATTLSLPVTFTPPGDGFYTTMLQLDGSLPAVEIRGTGGTPVLLCDLSTERLDFVADALFEPVSMSLEVRNLGNVAFDLAPETDRQEFTVLPGVPDEILPGQVVTVSVHYSASTANEVAGTLIVGPAVCAPVELTGRTNVTIEPGTNQVGFFFDEAYTVIEAGAGDVPSELPVHLVLLNASNPSGVAGWECRVAIGGEAQFSAVDLAGNAVNAGNPNNNGEYVVGLGLEPLPYAQDGTLLATFQLLVTDPDPNNVYLQLYPIQQASLPGLMAWVPWDDFSDLTPMLPVTGQPTVAWLNTNAVVGIGAPTPRAVQNGGTVSLAWSTDLPGLDGYHVDRRGPDGRKVRLTATLLPPAPTVTFTDRPEVPAGTTLHYSYVAVRQGTGIAVSPEVTVQLAGVPDAGTALLANVPNPFNPETRIRYRLAHPGQVRLTVYDVTGRLVRTLVDAQRGAGAQEVTWQGRDDAGQTVASGAYYVRLETADGVDHRKVMMLK